MASPTVSSSSSSSQPATLTDCAFSYHSMNTVICFPIPNPSGPSPPTCPPLDTLMSCLSSFTPTSPSPTPNTTPSTPATTVVVLPFSHLTPPGDWRHSTSPLNHISWSSSSDSTRDTDGATNILRLRFLNMTNTTITEPATDPSCSDIFNKTQGSWCDLFGHRRVTAVVFVLDANTYTGSLKDANAYMNTITATLEAATVRHLPGSIIRRMFVFNSFNDPPNTTLDLSTDHSLGSELVVFPPTAPASNTLELHLSVTLNDMAVSIFRQHESRIKRNDSEVAATTATVLSKAVTSLGSSLSSSITQQRRRSAKSHPLLTPIDDGDSSSLRPSNLNVNSKESESARKKQVARKVKLSADLALLAGSPMDAYSRYRHASELTRATFDPIWNAACSEGIAASLVAMADVGGADVDEFLATTFDKFTDRPKALEPAITAEFKDLTTLPPTPNTLPASVCEHAIDALKIYERNTRLSSLYSELAMKLAKYIARSEDAHVFGRYGEGEHCFTGDTVTGFRRLESSRDSVLSLSDDSIELPPPTSHFLPMPTQVVARLSRISDLLHRATAAEGLSPESRMRVCVIAAKTCMEGVHYTTTGAAPAHAQAPVLKFNCYVMRRKAAFFTTMAADSAPQRASVLWRAAAAMYPHDPASGSYGWASLRLAVLHGLSQFNAEPGTESALFSLLQLLSEVAPASQLAKGDVPAPLAASITAHKSLGSIEESHGSASASPPTTTAAAANLPLPYPTRGGEVSHIHKSASMELPSTPPMAMAMTDHPQSSSSIIDPLTLTPPRQSVNGALQLFKNKTKSALVSVSHMTPNFSLGMLDGDTSNAPSSGRRTSLSTIHSVANINHGLPQRGSITFNTESVLPTNKAHRSSSIGTVEERVKAEFAAATARALMDGGGADGGSDYVDLRPPLLSFPCVTTDTDEGFAQAAQRDVAKEIAMLQNGGAPAHLFNPVIVVRVAKVVHENKISLEKKKNAPVNKGDPIADNMETFFNPFEERRKEMNKVKDDLVCEGEQFGVCVELSNKLTIPLEVVSCRLTFSSGQEKASVLNFVLPPRNLEYPTTTINFEVTGGKKYSTMECVGLEFVCLSRTFCVDFRNPSAVESTLPPPRSAYPRSITRPKIVPVQPLLLRAVPPQPSLSVDGHTKHNEKVTVYCCPGEVKTLTPLVLSVLNGVEVEELQVSVASNRRDQRVDLTIDVVEKREVKLEVKVLSTTSLDACVARSIEIKYRGKGAAIGETITELYWRSIFVSLEVRMLEGPRIVKLRFKHNEDEGLIVPQLSKQRKILARAMGEDLKENGLMRRVMSRSEPEILSAWAQDTLSDSDEDDDTRSVGGRSGISTPVLGGSGTPGEGVLKGLGLLKLEGLGSEEYFVEMCSDKVWMCVDVENGLQNCDVEVEGGGGVVTSGGVVRTAVCVDRVGVGEGSVGEELKKKVVLGWAGKGRKGELRLGAEVVQEMINFEGVGWVEGLVKVGVEVELRVERGNVKIGEFIELVCEGKCSGGEEDGWRMEFVCSRGGGWEEKEDDEEEESVLWNGRLSRSGGEGLHKVEVGFVEEGVYYIWAVLVKENRVWASERKTVTVE